MDAKGHLGKEERIMAYPSMNKTYMQHKYNVTKCGSNRRKNKGVKYVVIHYTGTTASAKNNCIYFGNGNRNASADYFIDTDGTIYKFNENCALYYTWHCGDGKGKYGICNSNSIGIEVVSAGKEFTVMQKGSLRKLVTAIMADYGVPASRVVRHYDASRKMCPAPYAGSAAKNDKWKVLHAYITKAMTKNEAPKLKGTDLKGLTQSEVVKKVGPLFTADQKKSGILASVSMAQFILESAYGQSELGQKANNFFGMKKSLSGNAWAGSAWDGKSTYSKQTKEYENGRYVTVVAKFRKYPDIETSIADHSAYLNGAMNGKRKRYSGLKGCKDHRKAAQIIKNGGYATSPDYVAKLCSVIKDWDLAKYDAK